METKAENPLPTLTTVSSDIGKHVFHIVGFDADGRVPRRIGRPERERQEPGYVNDAATPERISVGLMQTLISTAREALGDPSMSAAKLKDPETSIRAGTAYIWQQAVRQRLPTNFDPPLVAIAYNAGSLRAVDDASNRWGLVQTRRGTDHLHADAFIEFFNDGFAVLSENPPDKNTPSFWTLLNERPTQIVGLCVCLFPEDWTRRLGRSECAVSIKWSRTGTAVRGMANFAYASRSLIETCYEAQSMIRCGHTSLWHFYVYHYRIACGTHTMLC